MGKKNIREESRKILYLKWNGTIHIAIQTYYAIKLVESMCPVVISVTFKFQYFFGDFDRLSIAYMSAKLQCKWLMAISKVAFIA